MKIFRHSHVKWAVIAQFFYVGAQVCVGSFFIRFSRFVMNLPEKDAALWWGSIAMVGFMVGRFSGTFFMKYMKPAKLLSLYSLVCVILLTVALLTKGNVAVYAILGVSLFYVDHVSNNLCVGDKRSWRGVKDSLIVFGNVDCRGRDPATSYGLYF